jgi:cytochrome c oxidase assembly protein subunit 15
MRTILKPLALVTTIGMFLVVVMGATVTNTNSAEGCGRSWPLCHGQLIPELAVSTMIEFSHRAVTGIETILVIAVALGAWVTYRQHREVRILSPLMVGTLFLQAGMGAWAVMYPQTPLVLALHFGISLAAFASALLTMTFIRDLAANEDLRRRRVSVAYRRAVWATLVYVLVVVYVGAYVRHVGYDLACQGWPLCNGAVFPGFAGAAGVVFLHRLVALGSILLLLGILAWSWRLRTTRPDLFLGSAVTFGAVILQALSGALVVVTEMGLFSALAHAGIMALLFGGVSYLCFRTLPPVATAASVTESTRATGRVPVA